MKQLDWEIGESSTHPGYWSAEAVDHDAEGDIYVVLFLGPRSREQAEEFVKVRGRQPASSIT